MPRRYCTFGVGGLLLGIDVERVQEVLRDQEITPVPLADPSVLGLLNLRGQIVTAIDARHRLGLAERTPGQSVAHVIVRCADEAVSLAVDVEDEVVAVDDEAYEHVPGDAQPEHRQPAHRHLQARRRAAARARHRSRRVGGGLRMVQTMNALVIDDSRAMRMILGRMLRELGMEVAEAANGRLALDLLDEGLDPGVVLVDWNMPEMTGIEFVAAVRQPPYLSTARIVMVTTETEVPQIAQALASGADEYVMKPFTKESIFEKLQLLGIEI